MSEWRECKLGDVCSKVLTGGTPLTTVAEYYSNGTIPWLKTKEVNFCRITETECFISEQGLANSAAKLIPVNSVIVAMYGQGDTAGRVAINKIPMATNQACCNLVIDNSIADYQFVFYLLWNSYEELVARKTGSAQPNLNTALLKSFDILLPPLTEQQAIASVLSSLDDKIDLLHRQNKTLEAMAETLFRQWFVEEAEESWEEVPLNQLCMTITKGTTPTTLGHSFTETGINFIKAESLTDSGDFIWDKFAKISEATHEFLNRSILSTGDVLCSIAGTIGRVAIVSGDILPANTNQAIAIIHPNLKKVTSEFIYLFLKSNIFRELMDGKIVHAVQPNLSLGEIGNTSIRMPPLDLFNSFQTIISPIFNKKARNCLQIRTLEKLRDTLLPKLMSGEVRVSV